MSDTQSVNRRDFVKVVTTFVGSVIGVVVGIPAIGYIISPATKTSKADAWIPVGPIESYEIGVPKLFSFTRSTVNGWEKTVNSYGVFVVKKSADQADVFSNLCTHLACRVNWKEDVKEYVCPCHDGRFSKEGKVVSGPPPAPLNRLETKLENGTLFVHLTEA